MTTRREVRAHYASKADAANLKLWIVVMLVVVGAIMVGAGLALAALLEDAVLGATMVTATFCVLCRAGRGGS